MLDGNVNSLMSQPLKELEEMDVRLSERFTSRILLQELKQSKLVTELGKTMEVKP